MIYAYRTQDIASCKTLQCGKTKYRGDLDTVTTCAGLGSVSARPEFLGVIDDPLFENLGVIGKFRGSELFHV